MGKRGRRRGAEERTPGETTDYTDDHGNVLTLRNSVSRMTGTRMKHMHKPATATQDDIWRRRTEFLFERFAVRWEIAGLPLEAQKELLGRYRLGSSEEQRWVRETLDRHITAHQPELAEGFK
jgi:hypothetical protein